MELKLEDLAYQREAIDAVVRLFDGQPRNTFDLACRDARIHYDAPVKDYPVFQARAKEVLHG